MNNETLINYLNKEYNKDIVNEILESYSLERILTLRINNIKTTKKEILSILEENNIPYEEITWYEYALTIPSNNLEAIKALEIYKEGKIYFQSLSSQLPPLFLKPKKDELILDMAAAPGGKTTELAALSNNESMITAMEKNKIRSERLKYNIEKQGAKKVTVLNTDARNLNEYFMFDKILLDAPCSGSGTLNNKSANTFNEGLINRSIKFQKELLEEAIKHLKINGTITYSTCSILKEENECVIDYILNKYNNIKLVPLDLTNYDEIPKLPSKEGTLTVKPNYYYEGFFVSQLKRVS